MSASQVWYADDYLHGRALLSSLRCCAVLAALLGQPLAEIPRQIDRKKVPQNITRLSGMLVSCRRREESICM